ncbi:MAG TPA: thioredoxin domain-containing protein [Pyrinomonadaceae bacterium]|nr:thioredoxin domain-containing protein [Pyrinomonadaceae bacterium]
MSAKRSPGPKPAAAARPDGPKKYLPFVIIAVVLVGVIGVAAYVLNSRSGDTGAPGSAAKGAANSAPYSPRPAAQRNAAPGASPAWEKGTASAPVVLEEFGDYQCPPCAMMHPVLQKIVDDYGDRVKLVFRHYPLQQIHPNAFPAARAAEAAGMQGKFWEMHDLIYDNQAQWKDAPDARPIFTDYARRLGLDAARFRADLEGKPAADRVLADFNRGTSLGVRGTPTIILNGRELPAEKTLSEPKLRAEIDVALAAAKGGQ